MSLQGLVKNIFRNTPDSVGVGPRYNPLGGLHVDQGLPSLAELTRQGLVYNATFAAGTEVVPVAAWPTTAAAGFLFNNNPESGTKNLVILAVYNYTVSGTMGLGMSLIAAITLAAQTTKPTAYSGSFLTSQSGRANNSGALIANAHTITGGTPAWRVVGNIDQATVIAVGSGVHAKIDGSMIVPPQHGLAINTLAPLGSSSKVGYGAVFAVVDCPLG